MQAGVLKNKLPFPRYWPGAPAAVVIVSASLGSSVRKRWRAQLGKRLWPGPGPSRQACELGDAFRVPGPLSHVPCASLMGSKPCSRPPSNPPALQKPSCSPWRLVLANNFHEPRVQRHLLQIHSDSRVWSIESSGVAQRSSTLSLPGSFKIFSRRNGTAIPVSIVYHLTTFGRGVYISSVNA